MPELNRLRRSRSASQPPDPWLKHNAPHIRKVLPRRSPTTAGSTSNNCSQSFDRFLIGKERIDSLVYWRILVSQLWIERFGLDGVAWAGADPTRGIPHLGWGQARNNMNSPSTSTASSGTGSGSRPTSSRSSSRSTRSSRSRSKPQFQPGDFITISEKVVTISQGRVVHIDVVKASPLAKFIVKGVKVRQRHRLLLPEKMQVAIYRAGSG